MTLEQFLRTGLLALAACTLTTRPAVAQTAKLGSDYHEDKVHGFKFRYPHGWLNVPVQASQEEAGLLGKMQGFALRTMIEELNAVTEIEPLLMVIELEDRVVAAATGEESAGLKGRVKKEAAGREDLGEVLKLTFSQFRDFEVEQPVEDEMLEVRNLPVHHRTWEAFTGDYDVTIDTWSFRLVDRDIGLAYLVPQQHEKKWLGVFKKGAKTFEEIEREARSSLGTGASYEEILAYHEEEASRIAGWRVVPTPSKNFLIKTSSDNTKFIKEVISRLEASRALFEKEFPPEKPIEHVSVVRVCSNEDEFHSYGNTSPGVAGWFNPASTELVLFDFVEYDRNFTYAVMTHEAFHQYCFFLFDQSEAHRWFDEGHGDYYGGAKFTGNRAKITSKMPSGLERMTGAKELVKDGTYAPLAKHLNFSHGQWQSQGPRNVSCYEQSWSIIYMLRQGMEGKVSSSVWEDEYAHIIPDYMAALHAGFKKAYAEILTVRETKAKADGRELTPEEQIVNRFDLLPAQKEVIWKEAMAASWGQIDLDEFEQNWLTYVSKYL